MNRFLRFSWAVLAVSLVGSLLWTFNELPLRVPTHFNGDGVPDGWSSRGTFFWMWLLTIAIANVWVVVFPWFGRWLAVEKNRRYLSMPNRDYWLSNPVRMKHTLKVLDTTFLVVVICSDMILMMAFRSIYGYSTTGDPHPMHWSLFAFLGGAVIFAVAYPLLAFRRPKQPGDSIPSALE